MKNGKSYIKTVYFELTQIDKIQLCKPVVLISFPHCPELPFSPELKGCGLTYQVQLKALLFNLSDGRAVRRRSQPEEAAPNVQFSQHRAHGHT